MAYVLDSIVMEETETGFRPKVIEKDVTERYGKAIYDLKKLEKVVRSDDKTLVKMKEYSCDMYMEGSSGYALCKRRGQWYNIDIQKGPDAQDDKQKPRTKEGMKIDIFDLCFSENVWYDNKLSEKRVMPIKGIEKVL